MPGTTTWFGRFGMTEGRFSLYMCILVGNPALSTTAVHDGALVGVTDLISFGIAKRFKNEIGEYIHINLGSRRSLGILDLGLEAHILVYIHCFEYEEFFLC